MSAALHLRIARDTVSAKVVRRRRIVWAAEGAFNSPEDLRALIIQLASEGSLPARPASLRVKLEVPLVQLRTLEGLPPVRPSALRALVAQQASRFFRKNGKPLVVDAVWLRRVRGQYGVAQAAAAEETWIEAVSEGARAAGLALEGIQPSTGVPGCKLSLLSPAELARRNRIELLALRRLAVLAASLWILGGIGFALRVQREERRIGRELSALDPAVRAVATARRKLGDAARMVEAVERTEREQGAMLRRLAAITAGLPDSAYLTSLTLDEGGGAMSGLAPQASRIVAVLERDTTIAAPRMTGPAVREVVAGKERERFTVTFVRRTSR